MTKAATIVIPTFDHAHTLYASVGSALRQTTADIEVFVVGDGVPEVTRAIVRDLMSDSRVRFFDNPKGECRGEVWRHRAIEEASGEIVCYLSDDDLFLKDHVASMREALNTADFVHAPPLTVDGEQFTVCATDLSDPLTLELMSRLEFGRFGPSYVAHTLKFYRQLPFGWRPAPLGTPTDQYMWQQCLTVPGIKAACTFHPTVLRFPAPTRMAMSTEERLAEMQLWSDRLADPDFIDEFQARFRKATIACASRELAFMRSQIIGLTEALNAKEAELRVWQESHAVQEATAAAWERGALRLEAELGTIQRGKTWTLRRLLVGLFARQPRSTRDSRQPHEPAQ